ncbi:hypothetical protein CC78DRAFT_585435 [Lojkania enalia]|uniref:Uncharacterized protein n=1 Tax=Lojkania enalia TaxID=147567 RepID=A0A9P4K2Z1_9PLEO|nr:hypothetical protein CC78DRAFT_585435 [Didymosphaeria enalia]
MSRSKAVVGLAKEMIRILMRRFGEVAFLKDELSLMLEGGLDPGCRDPAGRRIDKGLARAAPCKRAESVDNDMYGRGGLSHIRGKLSFCILLNIRPATGGEYSTRYMPVECCVWIRGKRRSSAESGKPETARNNPQPETIETHSHPQNGNVEWLQALAIRRFETLPLTLFLQMHKLLRRWRTEIGCGVVRSVGSGHRPASRAFFGWPNS